MLKIRWTGRHVKETSTDDEETRHHTNDTTPIVDDDLTTQKDFNESSNRMCCEPFNKSE